MDDERAAAVAHALAHPARVRILRLLAAQPSCMGSGLFSEVPLAQSTISQHLAVLKRAGLVHATPRGTAMVYCITAGPLEELCATVTELAATRPTCPEQEH